MTSRRTISRIRFIGFVATLLLLLASATANGQRFKFEIDAKTPLQKLLPTPPSLTALPPFLNEDLEKVPELIIADRFNPERWNVVYEMAHLVAKINHLNAKDPDGFMKALISNRADLRGLPFVLGQDSRADSKSEALFAEAVDLVHKGEEMAKEKPSPVPANDFWKIFLEMSSEIDAEPRPEMPSHIPRLPMSAKSPPPNVAKPMPMSAKSPPPNVAKPKSEMAARDDVKRARVAALMQVLPPAPAAYRTGLAKYLRTIEHRDATNALVNMALFATEFEVRMAALDGLKTHPPKDIARAVVAGFRHPLPEVSKRAAEALVKLENKLALAELLAVLEAPDPRAPATHTIVGKKAIAVRELVRVNHHRNCLLCHAPVGNEPAGMIAPMVLTVQPSSPPPPTGYPSRRRDDIFVRVDVTYLRQDFSMMMRVDNADPWPEMQRFDFLVRTREVTPEQAAEYEKQLAKQGTPPSHLAARHALRELTGLRPAEDTPQAWRRAIESSR